MKFFKYFDWSRKVSTTQKSIGDVVYVDVPFVVPQSTPYSLPETLTIKSTGRPVFIKFQTNKKTADASSPFGCLESSNSTHYNRVMFGILRNGTLIGFTFAQVKIDGGTSGGLGFPVGCLDFIDVEAPPGTNVYSFYFYDTLGNTVKVRLNTVRIIAMEL
nr:hypothetical protein CKG001_17600 [Bdellovibrio sp. CKG001]